MNRMNLRMAERLKQSQNTAASLTTFNEVDMSALIEFRKLYKEDVLKKTGVKLGFMSFFARACTLAMRDYPIINASIEGEGEGGNQTIVFHDYVDISVAVATETGLVTPVVRNVESLELIGVEKAIGDMAKKVCGSLAYPDRPELSTDACLQGPRQETHHRGLGRWHLQHQQRRRLRLNDGNAHH
jgi:2-oxoglutarate dehydrogenase E2 component (dihydrolipoamide succinyltransferase)